MCKTNSIAVEKLSVDTVANKTKTPFKRMYTVTLNNTEKGITLKAGVPYLVYATDITLSEIKIRLVTGGHIETIQSIDAAFVLAKKPEIGGVQYREKQINGVYHYLRVKK